MGSGKKEGAYGLSEAHHKGYLKTLSVEHS